MKSINMIVATTMALLLTTGLTQAADETNQNIINHNLSKRPYQEAPAAATVNKADEWEGATLIKEEATEKQAGPTQYQKFRIHMLGQRPYMQGNQ